MPWISLVVFLVRRRPTWLKHSLQTSRVSGQSGGWEQDSVATYLGELKLGSRLGLAVGKGLVGKKGRVSDNGGARVSELVCDPIAAGHSMRCDAMLPGQPCPM